MPRVGEYLSISCLGVGWAQPLAPPWHPDAKLLKNKNVVLLRMIIEGKKKIIILTEKNLFYPWVPAAGVAPSECLDAQLAGSAPGLWIPLLPPSWARPRGYSGLLTCWWLCPGLVLPGMWSDTTMQSSAAPPVGSTSSLAGAEFLLYISALQGRVCSSPDIYGTALSLVACLCVACRVIKAPLVRSSLGPHVTMGGNLLL